jgi:diguanylate cyclase (GGDEF)-like protein
VTDLPDRGTVMMTEFLSPELQHRLERCADLPTLPLVAARVLQLCREDDLDLKQVADAVALDRTLCANVVRLVNSPVVGLRQEIRSATHAIALLGLNAVRTLAISCSVVRDLRDAPLAGIDTIWKRSVVAAVAAREVALTLRFPAPDEAFLGALLQDLGMVALAHLSGPAYDAALTSSGGDRTRQRAIERDMFGADRGEVGGWLLGTWRMPGPLCLALAASHGGGPDLATLDLHDDVFRLSTIVRLSGILADVWIDADVARAIAHAHREARSMFGLGAGVVEAILARTAASIPGVASLFDLSMGDAGEIATTLELAAATVVTPAWQAARHVDWAHAAVDSAPLTGGALASERDDLTGLSNGARLEGYLADEFASALASGKPLTVIAVSVDGFRPLLQGCGQLAADQVLVGVARALDGNLRSRDLVARSSGEGFVLVLPETDAAGGRVVAERIRQKIERARSRAAEASSRAAAGAQSEPAAAVTASFGCATLGPARFATAVELLAAAEAALGQATLAGCNRVESDGPVDALGFAAPAARNAS